MKIAGERAGVLFYNAEFATSFTCFSYFHTRTGRNLENFEEEKMPKIEFKSQNFANSDFGFRAHPIILF
jgi:hypothetical protein